MSSLHITDVVLRDAHQSLLATRLRLKDMLPIAEKLDSVGFWSLETWGGATFDACIRYLGEDPWDRLRLLKEAMPKTRHQMLLRGQNILGYRHYADDVVSKFIQRASAGGIDVFRIFDALNDMRNLETAIRAVREEEKHAQGCLSYTLSPVHNLQLWLDKARQLEDMGVQSICIKDMAGLLRPYDGHELVTALKQVTKLPIYMQCHATTGLSTATILKCVEAGINGVDTAISSMAMTYGHSATESVVAIFQGTDRDTGLNLALLEEVATYFREIRKKYVQFEGSLRGVDSRILVAQVPGGMLTNMENQLKEQGALDRFDEVLEEIPSVRKNLGYIPLVTPTSQIVGTQAVLNVLSSEPYQTISRETASVLKGEYGATPSAVDKALQERVLEGQAPIEVRPADLLTNEMEQLSKELQNIAATESIDIRQGEQGIDDTLTYALFSQVALKFFKHRHDPDAFEPVPTGALERDEGPSAYTVTVEGKRYKVSVNKLGKIDGVLPMTASTMEKTKPIDNDESHLVKVPLAGNIIRMLVQPGQRVDEGEVLALMEAMKMETDIKASRAGIVGDLFVSAGDKVQVGDKLLTLTSLAATSD